MIVIKKRFGKSAGGRQDHEILTTAIIPCWYRIKNHLQIMYKLVITKYTEIW